VSEQRKRRPHEYEEERAAWAGRGADALQLALATRAAPALFGLIDAISPGASERASHERDANQGRSFITTASAGEKALFVLKMLTGNGMNRAAELSALREELGGSRSEAPPLAPSGVSGGEVIFLGDFLFQGDLGEETLSPALRARLARADLLVINLEGTIGPGGRELYPFQSLRGLSQLASWNSSGDAGGWVSRFDEGALRAFLEGMPPVVFSVANNHSLDEGRAGLERTVDAIERLGAAHVGALSRGGPGGVFRAGERQIGVAAVSFGHNHTSEIRSGEPDVCLRFEGVPYSLPRAALRAEVERLRGLGATYLVAALHWGYEHEHLPRPDQAACVKELWELGFHAVIGHHPHIVQPSLGDGSRWVSFSLGDFIGGDRTIVNRFSCAVSFGFPGGGDGAPSVEVIPLIQSPYYAPKQTTGLLGEAQWLDRRAWDLLHAAKVPPGADGARENRAPPKVASAPPEGNTRGESVALKVAPSPPAHPILGHAPALGRDPLGSLLRWMQEVGDVIQLRLGARHAHAVFHPDHVRWVLQENQKNYGKKTRGYETLSLFMGNGLLTSDGEPWKKQRRLLQPAFHREKIVAFGSAMTRAAEAAIERWEPWAEAGRPFDAAEEMMRITLRIVGETLFSVDLSAEADVVREAIRFLQEDANRRISAVFNVPLALPTKKNRELYRARRALDALIFRVMADRRRTGRARGQEERSTDLLGMLMRARDADTGEAMSDEEIRDELMTMFLAGHESTSNALTWTWYLLAQNPSAARRLRAELASVLGGRAPSIEDLPKLSFTRAVLQESMRLYPPAWSVGRAPIEDDVIGGYRIPAGSLVIVAPWATHRHPAFWENPEGFDPDRFLAEGAGAADRDKYRYIPFGAGPRVCIGNTFAMVEAQLVLATIAQRFRLDLVPGHPVEPEPLITLRPRFGLRVTAARA
jgi:cytochrome P450